MYSGIYKITQELGSNGGIKYYLMKNEKKASFWQDISLTDDNFKTVNFITEIPNNRIAKYQVNKSEEYHPITQDTHKRDYNIFRYYPQFPLFNYGYVPMTYESNVEASKYSEIYKGDDDPLDIIELSGKPIPQNSIQTGVVLSALCLIDQGELDWKIMVINSEESEKQNIKTIDDYISKYPNNLQLIKNWFKYIKYHEGKKINNFLFEDKLFNNSQTIDIIKYHSDIYNNLLNKDIYKDIRAKYHIKN